MIPARWRVGFADAGEGVPRFYQRFLAPGYLHCWAARRICRGLWYFVEWTPHRLVCGVVTPAFVLGLSRRASSVLIYEDQGGNGVRDLHAPLVSFVHCSTTLAHVLGLSPMAGLTPWRLACALRRRGAVMLMRHPVVEGGR